MKITKNCVVTLDYTASDMDGHIVDEGKTPITYLHGGYSDIFEKLEYHLEGKSIKDSVEIELMAHEAFGEYDESLVEIEDISNVPDNIQIGMQLEGHSLESDDGSEPLIYTVTEITQDKVVLDANHPLAGIDLAFSCTVIDIRQASDEEIASRNF